MVLKRLMIAVLIAVLCATAYFSWRALSIPSVGYVIMKLDDALETLLVSGRVVGEGAVPLSFKQPGQLTEILTQEGEQVFSSEVLAKLDDRQALNLLQQGENALSSAEIALSIIMNRDLPQARESLRQAEGRAEIAENLYQGAYQERLEPSRTRLAEAVSNEKKASEYYSEQKKRFDDGEISRDQLDLAREEWDLALNDLTLAREEEERIAREVDNLEQEKEIALSQKRTAQTTLESLENEELKKARLNVSQARTQLEQARLNLEQTELKAPYSGIITRLAANIGQFVNIGQEVVTIIPAASSTYIEAQVDEEFAGKIMVGQEVMVSSTAFDDQLFPGIVERVSPTVDPARGTFQVRFELDQFEPVLLPDLTVNAEIITERKVNSLILEQGFTFQENGQVFVLLEEGGKVKRRMITVKELGGGLFLVEEGLSAGDRVLTDLNLQEDQRVRLSEPESVD